MGSAVHPVPQNGGNTGLPCGDVFGDPASGVASLAYPVLELATIRRSVADAAETRVFAGMRLRRNFQPRVVLKRTKARGSSHFVDGCQQCGAQLCDLCRNIAGKGVGAMCDGEDQRERDFHDMRCHSSSSGRLRQEAHELALHVNSILPSDRGSGRCGHDDTERPSAEMGRDLPGFSAQGQTAAKGVSPMAPVIRICDRLVPYSIFAVPAALRAPEIWIFHSSLDLDPQAQEGTCPPLQRRARGGRMVLPSASWPTPPSSGLRPRQGARRTSDRRALGHRAS